MVELMMEMVEKCLRAETRRQKRAGKIVQANTCSPKLGGLTLHPERGHLPALAVRRHRHFLLITAIDASIAIHYGGHNNSHSFITPDLANTAIHYEVFHSSGPVTNVQNKVGSFDYLTVYLMRVSAAFLPVFWWPTYIYSLSHLFPQKNQTDLLSIRYHALSQYFPAPLLTLAKDFPTADIPCAACGHAWLARGADATGVAFIDRRLMKGGTGHGTCDGFHSVSAQ
ncbi:hypothetical protein B0H13DRAFT_1884090 [Mycena leptocephala]|nr:hypothetical protein B0H13DRAFT_1884090 [Mycena leptocephala]